VKAMPVPTEQLDADIRELDRRIGGRLEVIERSLASLREDFSAFRGSTDTNLKLIRWVGVFFAGLLVSLFLGIVTLTWHASAVNSRVFQLGEDFQSMRTEIKEVGARVDKMELQVDERLDKMERQSDTRFDKIERQLDLLIKSVKP
jgi:hypothetical protein